MSQLKEIANAIVAAIKAGESSGLTADHIATLDAAAAQTTLNKTDIADIKDFINTLSTGLAPVVTPPAAPAVTAISPASGSAGTPVTVTGTGFTGATAVNFGTVAGTNLTVASDTSLTVTSPALDAGVVDVTVITPAGTSDTGAADQFTAQ